MALVPIIPVNKIRDFKRDDLLGSFPNKEKPSLLVLSQENKTSILKSIRSLVRYLEKSQAIIQ